MKKSLFTVIIMILAFGLPAFAQPNAIQTPADLGTYPDPAEYGSDNFGLGQGAECPNCTVGPIPCPSTVTTIDKQGNIEEETNALYPFDFDGEAWVDSANLPQVAFGSYGYCSGYNNEWEIPAGIYPNDAKRDTAAIPNRNCKLLFDVCACPEACVVTPGERIGIQMIIDADGNFDTIDDGVYFTDPDMDKIYFGYYNFALQDGQYVVSNDAPCNPNRIQMNTVDDGTGNFVTRSFNEVAYYTSYDENKKYIKKDQELYDLTPTSVGQGFGWAPTETTIPAINRVVALESNLRTGGYVFTDTDERNCVLWIDIPAMRLDPTRAAALQGKEIRLRVRVLFNIEDRTICPECSPPDYCEVVVKVATICCGDVTTPTDKCMLFPYVLQNISPWWSGISVMARDTLPATGAAFTITAKDKAGNTGTYTVINPPAIWTSVIDSIIPQFTMTKGTAFESGAMALTVKSNYFAHGYSFLTDGTFGAGTLATGCTPGTCSP